jgi:hypothetical protein
MPENEDNKEIKKVPFETRIFRHPNGSFERKIFINGELLDWSVDVSSFREAQKMGSMYQRAIKADIAKHFTESVSEVLGRKVTMEEIVAATKSGWI